MKLTASNVKTLPARPGKTETVFFDDQIKGFGLRVKSSGSRSYVLCYKVAGEHRRVTIGTVGDTDFAAAKTRAKDMNADRRRGHDPAAQIKTAKIDTAQTYEKTVPLFLQPLLTREDPYRPRAYKEIERHLTKNARDLNKKPVAKITRFDVASVLEMVTAKSGAVTANRTRTSLSTFFAWTVQRGHAEINPVIGTEKNKERSRDRVLTPAELRLIWSAADETDQYGAIVRLLMLTGQREAEIGGLCKSEIHEALIILPERRTKNSRPHVVPLAPGALDIIGKHKKDDNERDLIFGRGKGGFSGWSKSKERLDGRIKKANDGKAIAHWTLHDLRRTLASYVGGGMKTHEIEKLPKADKQWASGLGWQPHVIFATLNQVSGYKGPIGDIYQRGSYDKEKRQLLEQWATHLQAMFAATDNVTRLRHA